MHVPLVLCIALALRLTIALPLGPESSTHDRIHLGITNSSAAIKHRGFDYIVCGGGLTGLTVASRLSEDPNISVLVIEAGHDNHADPLVNDVRTYGQAFGTELDHSLKSTPVPWQNNTKLHLVAGKTLGGSGSLNGASWTKGPRSQYDLLPMLTGDDSWGWEGLNKYMLQAENFHRPSGEQRKKGADFDLASHGCGGNVSVAFGSGMFGGPQLPALEASQRLWENLTRNPDAASGHVNGATIIPNMVYPTEEQARSSPYTVYAEKQVQERDNFVILTGHRVTELVWKQPSRPLVAEGVYFQASRNSSLQYVRARREVLLAAGSLQSPQILELSGVGDPEVLTAAGIEVGLPLRGVGKNMQEQMKTTLLYTADPHTSYAGTGPPSAVVFLTAHQLLGNTSSAWYANTTASLLAHAADLETRGLVPNATATHAILQAQLDNIFTSPDSAAAEVFFTLDPTARQLGADLWGLVVLARGTAHIRSASSWDAPRIECSYFGHPLDTRLQTQAAAQTRAVFARAPLAGYVGSEISPGPARLGRAAGDGEWEAWVKGSFSSVWHYVATLAMLKEELGGVVDGRLRVYGVRNVRVVDASVLPVQLSAHLSSSLYGVAEKAAVMIREDRGR